MSEGYKRPSERLTAIEIGEIIADAVGVVRILGLLAECEAESGAKAKELCPEDNSMERYELRRLLERAFFTTKTGMDIDSFMSKNFKREGFPLLKTIAVLASAPGVMEWLQRQEPKAIESAGQATS